MLEFLFGFVSGVIACAIVFSGIVSWCQKAVKDANEAYDSAIAAYERAIEATERTERRPKDASRGASLGKRKTY